MSQPRTKVPAQMPRPSGTRWPIIVMFALGAIVPVSPFIFLHGTVAVVLSIVLSMIGLFIIGGGITLFTGRSVLYSGSRQVAFGLWLMMLTLSAMILFWIKQFQDTMMRFVIPS